MPRIDRRSTNSRSEILDAAQRVASNKGAAHVTLDAVAQESGLSKGGVLYNFPNKDALIRGMVERLIDSISPMVEEYREALMGGPNPTLRAIARAKCADAIDPGVAMAILAAAAQKPELLEPLRAVYARHYARVLEEAEDPDLAMLMWAALDGLLFQTLLGFAPFPPERLQAITDRLQAHIEECVR